MRILGSTIGKGFMIFDWDVKIKSKDYGVENSKQGEISISLVFALLCTLVVLNLIFFLVFFPGWDLGWISIAIFFFCDLFFCLNVAVLLLLFRFVDLEGTQWHACEHKTINLLRSDKKVSLENLKKAKRVHWDCGTGFSSLLFVVSLGVLLLLKNGLLTWLWQEQIAPWYILPFLWGLIGLSFGPSLLLQYFFTTAEPTEEQLQEALDVAKRFVGAKSLVLVKD